MFFLAVVVMVYLTVVSFMASAFFCMCGLSYAVLAGLLFLPSIRLWEKELLCHRARWAHCALRAALLFAVAGVMTFTLFFVPGLQSAASWLSLLSGMAFSWGLSFLLRIICGPPGYRVARRAVAEERTCRRPDITVSPLFVGGTLFPLSVPLPPTACPSPRTVAPQLQGSSYPAVRKRNLGDRDRPDGFTGG